MKSIAKKSIPWLGTAAIFAYLGLTTDLDRFFASIAHTNPWAFVGVVVIGVLVGYLSDCFCLKILFHRFFGPVGFRDVMEVKGTSYFLNVVNYNAGAGGVALFMSKRFGFNFMEAIGAMIFLNAMDLFALSILLCFGMAFGSGLLAPEQQEPLILLLVGMGVLFVGTILFWVYKVPFLPSYIRTLRIFHGFRVAKLSDYAALLGARTPFVAHYVVLHWAFMPLFGLDIPFSHLLVYVPILIFITVLPISIAGLGTTQVAMRYFLAPYPPLSACAPLIGGLFLVASASGADPTGSASIVGEYISTQGTNPAAQIDAYSTSSILGLLAARIGLGLFTVRSVSRDFTEEKPAT